MATGVSVTLLELSQTMSDLGGRRLDPIFEPERPGDIRHSAAATDLIAEKLGFRATVDLRDGLRRLMAHGGMMSDTASATAGAKRGAA